jgi:thiamine-phosphate pyrophosphorylase
MPEPIARLYLVTPIIQDAQAFAPALAQACAAGEVAAVLLRLAAGDERTLTNRVKARRCSSPRWGKSISRASPRAAEPMGRT